MKLPYCLPEVPLLIKYTAEFSPNYCNYRIANIFMQISNLRNTHSIPSPRPTVGGVLGFSDTINIRYTYRTQEILSWLIFVE